MNFFLFDSSGGYITATFTVAEELTVFSMFSNAFVFHEDVYVIVCVSFLHDGNPNFSDHLTFPGNV